MKQLSCYLHRFRILHRAVQEAERCIAQLLPHMASREEADRIVVSDVCPKVRLGHGVMHV